MTKYLVQKFFWLREKSLIQISQKTLAVSYTHLTLPTNREV